MFWCLDVPIMLQPPGHIGGQGVDRLLKLRSQVGTQVPEPLVAESREEKV